VYLPTEARQWDSRTTQVPASLSWRARF
jgi:hypothetical protein